MVNKVALGQVFSEYFGSRSQFLFHQKLHTHVSSGAGTIGQLVAEVPSGLGLIPPSLSLYDYTALFWTLAAFYVS
jgi:hypothetical protein